MAKSKTTPTQEEQQEMDDKQSYNTEEPSDEFKTREETQEDDKKESQPMGDVYDVYAKAAGVHSKLTGMTEDYTLTRYNEDIYNMKIPKFIREQRKLLRIIKSYIIVPVEGLKAFYGKGRDEKAKEVHELLKREYRIIEELLLGELDETVIMGRTPNGEVITAFLEHGMNPYMREDYESETESPSVGRKLLERDRK